MLAGLEELEGGHGADAVGGGDVADVVDVDLGEGQVAGHRAGASQLGVDGRDLLAGRAPVGVEVDGDVGRRGHEGRELGGRGDVVDLVVRHCTEQ